MSREFRKLRFEAAPKPVFCVLVAPNENAMFT